MTSPSRRRPVAVVGRGAEAWRAASPSRRTPCGRCRATTLAATLCPVHRPQLTIGAAGRRSLGDRPRAGARHHRGGPAVGRHGGRPGDPAADRGSVADDAGRLRVTGLIAGPGRDPPPVSRSSRCWPRPRPWSVTRWAASPRSPGTRRSSLVFLVALHAGRRRALVVYLGGVAGLSVSLLLQPPAVATASSWISTVLTVTVAWLAGENLRSRRARRRDELDEAHRQVAARRPRGAPSDHGGAAADRPRPARRGGPLDERHRRPGRRRAPRHRRAARDRSATPSAASRSPPGRDSSRCAGCSGCSAPRTTRPTTPA